MTDVHGVFAWIAIGLSGATGVWGLVLAARRRQPDRPFLIAAVFALTIMLAQGGIGLILYAGDGDPGSGHLFYGMVIAAAIAFGYIYRSQLEKRAALAWGLFLLFLMGAGFRAIANIGAELGG